MGFRINTNIAAMTAHNSATNNNRNLDNSLSKLSSGLRINKAADDASGMTIADTLRAQAKGLGQAINNANDGISVVQTADGALDEYINIINTVRTKSIQAASDGQNADSRAAIQRDIDKLLEEAQNIAKTTSFNGQQLLDGTFTNKAFHIGAYAGETVGISVGNVQTNSIGGITSIENTTTNGGTGWNKDLLTTTDNVVAGSTGVVYKAGALTVNGTDVTSSINTLSPNSLISAKSIAAAITDATGLLTSAKTEVTGDTAVTAGAINATTNSLKINGINIGTVTVLANDSDGALVKAINDVSNLSGVTAENVGGSLKLTAADGKNISITTGTATLAGGGAGTADTISGFTTDRSTVDSTAAAVANLGSTGTTAVTLAEGALIINGVDLAGTYGDGTAGSAGQQFLAAVRNISGMEDSYLTDAGADATVNFVVNNGNDLNLGGTATAAAGTFETATVGMNGVLNNSVQGDFQIYSNEKVVIGGSSVANFGLTAGGFTPQSNGTSLDSIDVNTRESAEVAIMISDSALKALDTTRSELGSVQNQLESTIRNISVTQVNVTAAESQIRDVDFAAESANFSKFNILAQSGSYAMSQANAVQQNVLRLLQ